MYSRVCLLCIIVTLSLGHVASKAGVEENDKIFSLNFDVIHPMDIGCEFLGNTSKCEVELSAESAKIENIHNGFRFLIPILIGDKIFRVQLDTGSNALWVISDRCKDISKDHTIYHLTEKHLVNYKKFAVTYTGGEVGGILVEEKIQLTHNLVIKKQLFGAAAIIRIPIKGFDGVMGLNMDISEGLSSVFFTMIQEKLIKEPIYSIYLIGGASSKNGGLITFGGHIGKLFVEKSGIIAPMNPNQGRTLVTMTSLSLDKEFFCSDKIKPCLVLVDSGYSQITGPKGFVDTINKILKPSGIYNEVDCKNVDLAPTIEIMFDKQKLTMEPKFYTFKFTGKCYTTVFETPKKTHGWIFGVPFFVKFYIEFNFTEKKESVTFWIKK